jgi:hypothetical protein
MQNFKTQRYKKYLILLLQLKKSFCEATHNNFLSLTKHSISILTVQMGSE